MQMSIEAFLAQNKSFDQKLAISFLAGSSSVYHVLIYVAAIMKSVYEGGTILGTFG